MFRNRCLSRFISLGNVFKSLNTLNDYNIISNDHSIKNVNVNDTVLMYHKKIHYYSQIHIHHHNINFTQTDRPYPLFIKN